MESKFYEPLRLARQFELENAIWTAQVRVQEYIPTLIWESPRGCLIVAQSLLDDLVKDLLRVIFTWQHGNDLSEGEDKELFGPFKSLGSLAANIRIANVLGLMTDAERKLASKINGMRVAVAHNPRYQKFDQHKVNKMLAIVRENQSPRNNVDAVLANWDDAKKDYLEQYKLAPKVISDRDVCDERFAFCACTIVLASSIGTTVEMMRLASSLDRIDRIAQQTEPTL